MLRLFSFLAFVFLVGLGFAWLADRPGDMVVTFNGYRYELSLMSAAVIVAAIVAVVMIVWWLLKAVWNSPFAIRRYFRVRRRDRGYQALSTGLIAAGAGDAALARRKNREAARLINSDQEPLINLLDAQALLLEGNHDAARRKFEAMLDDPEMKLLGLRGLYLEAERVGERSAARHFAAQASEIAPQLGWASESTLEERVEQGDWDAALGLVDAQRMSRQIDKDTLNRRRAVLLTAKAMSALDSEPLAARNAAQEAVRLAPGFVPAALVAARASFRQDDVRKGAKLLEAVWKKTPHPQLAELYVHARPGDSTHDRLVRARKLQALKANHPESFYAVARAALEAGELKEAREAAEALLRLEPRERACLLMADIEEAAAGGQGRVREWLGRALRAPRDAAWVADGYVSDRWAPFSPVSGRIDAFEWRVPMEQVAQPIEANPARGKAPAILPADRPEMERKGGSPVNAPEIEGKVAQPAGSGGAVPTAAAQAVRSEPATPAQALTQAKPDRPRRNVVGKEADLPSAPAFLGPPDDPGVDDDEGGPR